MERIWYYAVDTVRQGPVSLDELQGLVRGGTVRADDWVWQPAFGSQWRRAGSVAELSGLTQSDSGQPPPLMPPLADFSGEAAEHRPSAVRASGQAFRRMADVLFRPFDLARWFSIGFCAWLAYIGTQQSSGFDLKKSAQGEHALPAVKHLADKALARLSHLTAHEMMLAGTVVVFMLLIALALCALRSRGDFMFLHRWYRPDALIGPCWRASRNAGHALFVWRVGFFFVALGLFALDAVWIYLRLVQPYLRDGKVWSDELNAPLATCVAVTVLLAVAVEVVAHLARAFVVPVMYWSGGTVAQAWTTVFALCNRYPFAVVAYLVWGALCWLAAAIAIILFVLCTCCVGLIPLMIPYISAVVLLPVFYFFRGYPVCFLTLWRPAVFSNREGMVRGE